MSDGLPDRTSLAGRSRSEDVCSDFSRPMLQSVYLETSVIGYLASRPSADLVTAGNQRLTLD